jgi:FkbM family methyltransferase
MASNTAPRAVRLARSTAHKQVTGLRLLARSRAFRSQMRVVPRDDLVRLGSPGYGFWVVPARLLGEGSVCYLAGVGEDITFDLGLIARFGCSVHAFDPVPRSQAFAEAAAAHEPRFRFHPVGLWSKDETLSFHSPSHEGYISHSATNIHGTAPAFQAEVRSVRSLMDELGHDRIDLLKVSAEGSEYEILRGVLDDGVRPGVICVEFAQPAPAGEGEETYAQLGQAGYDLVSANVSPWNWKLSFVRRDATAPAAPAAVGA